MILNRQPSSKSTIYLMPIIRISWRQWGLFADCGTFCVFPFPQSGKLVSWPTPWLPAWFPIFLFSPWTLQFAFEPALIQKLTKSYLSYSSMHLLLPMPWAFQQFIRPLVYSCGMRGVCGMTFLLMILISFLSMIYFGGAPILP